MEFDTKRISPYPPRHRASSFAVFKPLDGPLVIPIPYVGHDLVGG